MYQVRNGQIVVPTCDECGCRLMIFENAAGHFYGTAEADARGCRCSKYYTVIVYDSPATVEEEV